MAKTEPYTDTWKGRGVSEWAVERERKERKDYMAEKENNTELIMYQTEDGTTKLSVRMENDTVWLSQKQMSELFQKNPSTISRHINNVFDEKELERDESNLRFLQIATSTKPIAVYSLDVIISVGYRVKSLRGTQFRKWANSVLKEYLIKGFAMDDERLKGNAGGNYWKELLARIKDIRSSEKVMYRQVLDLYATSADYNKNAPESVQFFRTVQNKFHYAVHQHTAAELIYERADANKPFMGLTSFSGNRPIKKDTIVAKNYLSQEELTMLNNLVSAYFDLAENAAIRHKTMYMKDYLVQLDALLMAMGDPVLTNAGKISKKQAQKKAEAEYSKYQANEVTQVEQDYLETISSLKELSKELSK